MIEIKQPVGFEPIEVSTDNPEEILITQKDYTYRGTRYDIINIHPECLPTLISHLIEMGGVATCSELVLKDLLLSDEAFKEVLDNYHLVPKKKI